MGRSGRGPTSLSARLSSGVFPKFESYRAHRRVGKIAWHGRCDDARRHAILPTRSDQAARPDRVGKGAHRPHECGQPCQAPLPTLRMIGFMESVV